MKRITSRPRTLAALGALALACVAPSLLVAPAAVAQSAMGPQAGARAPGYLADRVPDHKAFLPPPPAAGSAIANADLAIFNETRALENTPRWQLATQDDRADRSAMLGNFSCAVGIDLATAELPALTRLLQRAGSDLFPIIGPSKDLYQRPRPFVTEKGPVCITPSEGFARSGSYPSGHAAAGWLHALLLAEIDPENAAAIINRGRAFGESRVVCGVHYLSDVEGGRLAATALVAALHGVPEFEADVDAARAELEALRKAAAKPDGATCAATEGLLATPW
jgi:acid phosphatase (class A)